jgi:Fe-S cluster biogenesis protein NfuA
MTKIILNEYLKYFPSTIHAYPHLNKLYLKIVVRQKSQTILPENLNIVLMDKFGNTEETMEENIKGVLEQIRPSLQADGGDVEFVGVKNGVVSVRLTGACGGCPMSQMTLKMGIERLLKSKLPEVKEVVAV